MLNNIQTKFKNLNNFLKFSFFFVVFLGVYFSTTSLFEKSEYSILLDFDTVNADTVSGSDGSGSVFIDSRDGGSGSGGGGDSGGGGGDGCGSGE
jgi:uncharacterized membrane protein YgcG